MGRPLKKDVNGTEVLGSVNAAGTGFDGESVASVTLSGINSGYTGIPTTTVANVPKKKNGTRATIAVSSMGVASFTLVDAGTGYTANDIITVVGLGTGTAATLQVTAITGGGATGPIDSVSILTSGEYTVVTGVTGLSVTGGTGADATFTFDLQINGITVTEPGAGYTAVPAVSISGTATGTAVMVNSGSSGIPVSFFDTQLRTDGIIIKQRGTKTFQVARSGTPRVRVNCVLVGDTPNAINEMSIVGYVGGTNLTTAIPLRRLTKRVAIDWNNNIYTWYLKNNGSNDFIVLIPATA
jgi:hypothetical protein